jgi:hypothetical protein
MLSLLKLFYGIYKYLLGGKKFQDAGRFISGKMNAVSILIAPI